MTATPTEQTELGPVVVQLMKGPLYRESHERLWHQLLALRHQVSRLTWPCSG